eukprot:scaffold3978_cov61-Phaeocystis_antarctica.AAC.6
MPVDMSAAECWCAPAILKNRTLASRTLAKHAFVRVAPSGSSRTVAPSTPKWGPGIGVTRAVGLTPIKRQTNMVNQSRIRESPKSTTLCCARTHRSSGVATSGSGSSACSGFSGQLLPHLDASSFARWRHVVTQGLAMRKSGRDESSRTFFLGLTPSSSWLFLASEKEASLCGDARLKAKRPRDIDVQCQLDCNGTLTLHLGLGLVLSLASLFLADTRRVPVASTLEDLPA